MRILLQCSECQNQQNTLNTQQRFRSAQTPSTGNARTITNEKFSNFVKLFYYIGPAKIGEQLNLSLTFLQMDNYLISKKLGR